MKRRIWRSIQLAALSALASCGGVNGPFVWINELPAPTTDAAVYRIGVGDQLFVQVWDNDKLSVRTRVRSDGRISMPLIPELVVVGQPPADVAAEITRLLKDGGLVLAPRVTVSVEEMKTVSVSVLGKVIRPGSFNLEAGSGVAEAIASAGGLSEFAHQDRIFVVRRVPEPLRVRFTMDMLTGQNPAATLFRLRAGDLIVAE